MKIQKICECRSAIKAYAFKKTCISCWECENCGARGCDDPASHKIKNVINTEQENTNDKKFDNRNPYYNND